MDEGRTRESGWGWRVVQWGGIRLSHRGIVKKEWLIEKHYVVPGREFWDFAFGSLIFQVKAGEYMADFKVVWFAEWTQGREDVATEKMGIGEANVANS